MASYRFPNVDRDVLAFANGMWCYTVVPFDDECATRWVSSKNVKRYIGDHCPARCLDSPLKLKAYPTRIFGFRKDDDPLWPHCSLLHFVAMGFCETCPQNDRLYIFRASLLQNGKTHLLDSLPLGLTPRREAWTHGAITAYQSDGFIFFHLDNTFVCIQDFPVFMYDLKNSNFGQFDTGLIDDRRLLVISHISTDEDEEGDSTVRLQVFSYERVTVRDRNVCKLYCQEVEHSRTEKRGRVLASAHHDLADFHPRIPFPSGDTTVFPFEDGSGSQRFVLYNMRSNAFDVAASLQEFLLNHAVCAKFIDRYREMDAHAKRFYSEPCLLTKTETMVARNSGALWRTSFQPVTLKYLATRAVFQFCGAGNIDKFNDAKWRALTKVDLPGHF